jgi:hypothetical protein
MESRTTSVIAEWCDEIMVSATDNELQARKTEYPRTKTAGKPVSRTWNSCEDCIPRSTHFKATFCHTSSSVDHRTNAVGGSKPTQYLRFLPEMLISSCQNIGTWSYQAATRCL